MGSGGMVWCGGWVGSGGGQMAGICAQEMFFSSAILGHKKRPHKLLSSTSSSVSSMTLLSVVDPVPCALALTLRCMEICQGNSPREANSPLTIRVWRILL